MKWLKCAVIALGVSLMSHAEASDIGFVEDFALAKDRAEALKKLIPGTEDYYYYHCLHYLNTEQFDKIEPLTKIWFERFNQTQRLTEIQTRYAFLTYNKDPQRTLSYFRRTLGLNYPHQRIIQGGSPNLPTALDAKLIRRDTLKADSLARWPNLENFEDSAMQWLANENLSWERRRLLLQRLERPDIQNLPALIVEDLKAPNNIVFGQWKIHYQLTLDQLNELLKLKPDLLNQDHFVRAMLQKLHPGDDEDWQNTPALLRAYLDRLLAFVRKLDPANNSLKAHVLFNRLLLDQTSGNLDKALFLEYLTLPRQRGYMPKEMLDSEYSRRFPADLNADWKPVTLLPIVRDDEALVRYYLKHLLLNASGYKEFAPFINDSYLRAVFAETKIEAGLGDVEQWANYLSPESYRALKERIDIDFAPTNKTHYKADEPVSLNLWVKNVPTLMVKVFEINTANFYQSQQREVDTAINLDGLVANSEKTYAYTEDAVRRVSRKFEFPQLNKAGLYVIDFIGAGKSSRALIHKGRLLPLVTTSTVGQKLVIVDENKQIVTGCTVWLHGQEYKADDTGVVYIPFSTASGQQPIVIKKGDFASLDYLLHASENYKLQIGFYVDREALLTQRIATIVVRPSLLLNDQPVSLKLLKDAKLVLSAKDLDGIVTTTEVPNFKLFEDRESTHEFRVPARLNSLDISLQATVNSRSLSKPITLSAGHSFVTNEISKTEKIEDIHLAKFGSEYVLEVRGRTGEPKPERPVTIGLKHRDFKTSTTVQLKTNSAGRIQLGELLDITSLAVTGPEQISHTWNLSSDRHSYRKTLHSKRGDIITLPYMGKEAMVSRDELSLFELHGSTVFADRFGNLSIKDAILEIKDLPAGDFELWLKKSDERIQIRVTEGNLADGYVLGDLRELQLPGLKPVQISSLTLEGDNLVIQLRDISPFTRVHVFGTRYQPAFSAFEELAKVRDAELKGYYPTRAESIYLSGRNIGDEYRYVLDRRLQKHYPGNMLDRPALLLNPWVLRSTVTGEQLARDGEEYEKLLKQAPAAALPSGPPAMPRKEMQSSLSRATPPQGDFSNLDFLFEASVEILNLVPDKDGVIKLPKAKLGSHSMIQVIAVDPLNTTARTFTLPESKADFVDLRLRNGLDPKGRFTQQKQASILTAGQPFVLADAAASRFEVYDSLNKVFTLYATLSGDPKLAEFRFLLNWPNLKPEEKRKEYSDHACHELNFFLYRKDPEFFKSVVKPYLANKKDKTFLDLWLLEADLSGYLQPWAYSRLNTVEKILLAERLIGEQPKTTRHLNDLLRLLPPNNDRSRMLFETAVKAGELSLNSDALGLSSTRGVKLKATYGGADGGQGEQDRAGENFNLNALNDTDRKKDSAKRRDGASGPVAKAIGAIGGKDEKGALEKRNVDYFADEPSQKQAIPDRLYRKVDPTNELAENNYYKLPIHLQIGDLVGVSNFWVDYSKRDLKAPFLSRYLPDASHNFTEMMFALSVLDLPFTAGKHDVKFDAGHMTFTPAGTVLAFHEEVKPVAGLNDKVQILVSQNFYRLGDRYKDEDGERFDKFVTDEFVIQTVYGCQIVVTNPTPSRQRLNVLMQIPVGAIALANGQATKTVAVDLEPYRTQILDYRFYFPMSGKYQHLPVQVAKAETLVATGTPFTFNVVDKPTKLDTESWEYVSQNGTGEQVLAMLERENINSLDLEKIAFRLKDKAFFESIITLLKSRHVYQQTVWSYAIFHNKPEEAREYFNHADAVVNLCGGPLQSPLLTIDPTVRHQYQHLEYKPLVNARAHALGHARQIVNGAFQNQYQQYLKLLSYRTILDDTDLLAVTYYLLLQDRIEEAVESFAKVNAANISTKMQYDYCAAYLDMYQDNTAAARAIALNYANAPVDRWRNTFAAIINQLDEIEGKAAQVTEKNNRDQEQARLAAKEPSLDFTIDNKTINLNWNNLDSVTINYYLMDVELLFSRNPFVQQSGSRQFSMVRPNESKTVKLVTGQNKLAIPLPEEFLKKNVLVEITSKGKTQALPYYANAMNVTLKENYGQLQATDAATGKLLPKVYVKTYVRLADGTVKFHKDGYTDLRGKFDYASVSTPEHSSITKFGILVLSETQGALIREVNPPQQ
ncbi:hypothetical protein KIH39_17285 [Telmatocola sphagniphila]|uniref:Alpha-2-macroglobulin domain-containing protein n=1 Tax=Telmatocola sphagniphila TaxID=1123043 RepID=A0A8E6B373_9BACT|nr:hypothetical protein [Telmatocola sphagniphila]QVL30599.1 hypothetical protein KIH39_17285 [Telmatocola sphagniphila]